MEFKESKRQVLFVILTGIFLTNALLAELVGSKIFSLEVTLGFEAGQFLEREFNLTAGVVLWPVVFITTDVINEYFGKKGVQQISFLTVALILYAFVMIWVISGLSPAEFWLSLHQFDSQNQPLNINEAFTRVFQQGMSIILGSLVAFLVGQFLDVYIFQKLRHITKGGQIWFRATGSTLISQLVDSFVVLLVAFYWFGNPAWHLEQVFDVAITNYTYKFIVAILVTPLIYGAHYVIEQYLGKEYAQKLAENASQN